jgi:hypothetical protein
MGDYTFTSWGFLLTLIGAFLAALKGVLTNVLQSPPPIQLPIARSPTTARLSLSLSSWQLGLHPLDLLSRLSFLACLQCVAYARYSGELSSLRTNMLEMIRPSQLASLALNGVVAFGLNIVSFYANRKTGPLSMSVAGGISAIKIDGLLIIFSANLKQVLTILLAVSVFKTALSPLNLSGILLSLIGGVWYARVEYIEKGVRY